MAYNFDDTRLSGGTIDPSSIDMGGSMGGASAGDAMPLPWANFALKGASAAAGGIAAYLQYKEMERRRKLEERMMQSADDRAWEQLRDNQRAYVDSGTQRSANAAATLGQVTSQNQSLRDKLMMLSGTVRR